MSTPIIFADNVYTLGTPVATGTDSGSEYDAANLNDYRTYTYWKSSSSDMVEITIDAGSSQTCDTLGIIAHNLSTADALVSVYSSTNGSTWTIRLAAFTPSDDTAIMKTFSSISARYWKLRIAGPEITMLFEDGDTKLYEDGDTMTYDGPLAATPQMAVLFIGERIDMPERVKAVFVPENISIQAQSSRSKAGNLLGSVIRHKPFTLAPEWNGLTYTFVNDTYLQTFWETHYSEMKPYFWAHDIGTFPDEIFYVNATNNGRFRRPLLKNDRVVSLVLPMEGFWE